MAATRWLLLKRTFSNPVSSLSKSSLQLRSYSSNKETTDDKTSQDKKTTPTDDIIDPNLPPWPGGINPNTGERGGPRGPEPTRYGDWERKGRVSDF